MVSVIIPAFNAEKTIVNALKSIKNQECRELFEVIVINDGSTDNTKGEVEDFSINSPELNLILIHQENKGVSAARNVGLRLASGDFIAFLDADDVWMPKKIEKQLEILRNPALTVDFLTTLNNNETIGFPYRFGKGALARITVRKLLVKIVGQTSTAVFRRKILENTGFFHEDQRYSEDANFWMRATKKNNMYILKDSLVICGGGKRSFGESGLSANLREMESGIQKNLLEMYRARRIFLPEFLFFFLFSKLKYFRRILLTKYGF